LHVGVTLHVVVTLHVCLHLQLPSACHLACWYVRKCLSLRAPADSNVWVATVELPQGLDLEYKFVVWKAAMRDGAGERNRRLHIPADGGKLQAYPQLSGLSKHSLAPQNTPLPIPHLLAQPPIPLPPHPTTLSITLPALAVSCGLWIYKRCGGVQWSAV
jgi:hypothetical protein